MENNTNNEKMSSEDLKSVLNNLLSKINENIDNDNLSIVKETISSFFDKSDNFIDQTTFKPVVDFHQKESETITNKSKSRLTLVTGLWDIGRGDLGGGWSRSMTDYLKLFEKLLTVDYNLIIFGDKALGEFVKERRSEHNTQFIERDSAWFRNNEFFDKIQTIRNNPQWYKQSGWLVDSTQARLEMYNPLVMSKVFLLHDAKILDKFDSEYLFWIDAGINKTVNIGYLTHDKVLEVLPDKISDFLFVCFPYDGKVEIHGFEYKKMCQYAGSDVDMVARGGFFGGTKESISLINSLYYSTLSETLNNGYMGTEESVFTILTYRNPNLIQYAKIEQDGLLFRFFEELKSGDVKLYSKSDSNRPMTPTKVSNVALYVIGFNSPKQFQTLIDSMLEYDPNFIDKPKKYLLDNSTNLETTPTYIEICEKYGFEHIKKDNIGICGGRQWIAEHADENGFDGYWFSEDDMFFQKKPGDVCKNGFNRYVDNFYNKCLDIVKKEGFDFLKINFTEFYGDNSTQWSWYNVPQDFREKNWPEKSKLPVSGLDPDAPRTAYKNIKSLNGLPYATGEIYYSNWTQFVTKEGNRKMFLDTKWAHPFENTWMSHMYQETIKGNLRPGILLMTPIEHNRFDHYDRSIRREN